MWENILIFVLLVATAYGIYRGITKVRSRSSGGSGGSGGSGSSRDLK